MQNDCKNDCTANGNEDHDYKSVDIRIAKILINIIIILQLWFLLWKQLP